MSGKNVNFRDKKIKKWLLQKQKVTKKDDIDVKEDPYGTKNSFKYFIGYNDNDFIRPLCISFHKWLTMLENLMVIQECPLRLVTNNC